MKNKINPATGRPHSMDKKLGADKAGMARRKAEQDAWAKKQRAEQDRRVAQANRRKNARWN